MYGIVDRLIGEPEHLTTVLTKLSCTLTFVHERVMRHSSLLLRLPPRAFPILRATIDKTASYFSTPADSAYTIYIASK